MNRETDSFRAIARQKTRASRASRFSRLDQYGWTSEHLDDPHLADWLITTLERSHLSLRDQIIIRIACESGARITEILSITVGDWRSRGCQQEISFSNKSHRDQQKKLLHLKPETVKLLLCYVEGKQYDVQHCELKLLADTDPLFLSRRHRAYSYKAFAANWKTLCAIEGIALPLHGSRVWYVINALRWIDAHANRTVEAECLKEKLAQSMGWQSPAPLHKYESYLRAKTLAEDLNALFGARSLSPVAEPCIHKLTCHVCGLNAHLPKDIIFPSTLMNLTGQDEKHQQEERRDYEE